MLHWGMAAAPALFFRTAHNSCDNTKSLGAGMAAQRLSAAGFLVSYTTLAQVDAAACLEVRVSIVSSRTTFLVTKTDARINLSV